MALAERAAGTVERGPVLFPDRYVRRGAEGAARSAIFARVSGLAVLFALQRPVRGGGRGGGYGRGPRHGLAALGSVEQPVSRVGARPVRVHRRRPFANLALGDAPRAVICPTFDATHIHRNGRAAR